jgi:hypothetical protein
VVQVLEKKGLTMVQLRQGFASMNPPMKELERLVLAGKIKGKDRRRGGSDHGVGSSIAEHSPGYVRDHG